MFYQNINDLFCRQTIVAWNNLKAQDDSLCINDDLTVILSHQLPKQSINGKFYSLNLMNHFSFVFELRKAIQDRINSTPEQDLALPVTSGAFLFQ